MGDTETLTIYLQVEGDSDDIVDRIRQDASEIPGVDQVDLEVEDVERSTVEILQQITLTLSMAGGAVGAASLLLTQVKALIESTKGVRAAWRDTDEGPEPLQTEEVPQGE
jgi:cell division protein FtsX